MNYPNQIIKEGESDVQIVKAIGQQLTNPGYGSFNTPGIFNKKTTTTAPDDLLRTETVNNNGISVFQVQRKIALINKGFIQHN